MKIRNKFIERILEFYGVVVVSLTLALFIQPLVTQAYEIGIFGVGGRLVPSVPPPFGDSDVLNFPPGDPCSPTVVIIGPEGTSWGSYQWGVDVPYDEWFQSYETNGYPYTHADEYMLGTAVWPNPNPFCPLPLLTSIGTSLFKATISGE